MRTFSRRQLLRAAATTAGAGLALGPAALRPPAAWAQAPPAGLRTENLGPASLSFPLVGAALVGDRLVLVSRNLEPTRVITYDLATGTVVAEAVVPTGLGAWGVATAPDGTVVLGMFGAQATTNLYRVDPVEGAVEPLGAVPAVYVWDLTVADDGTVYGVTDDPGGAFALDPASGAITDLGAVAADELPRSCTVVGDDVVIGGSRERLAMLRAVDRGTGAVREILPAALADHGIVYTVEAGAGALVAATRGPGEVDPAVAILDAAVLDPAGATIAVLAGESVVDAVAVTADEAWVTARLSGTLWRVPRDGGEPTTVAQPIPLTEHRSLHVVGDRVVGVAGGGALWSVDPTSGDAELVDLVADGLVEGGPERPQSLAAGRGHVYAGGTFGFSARHVTTRRLERWYVPGEPKGLAIADSTVYLGLYPVAQLWALPAGRGPDLAAQLPVEQNRPLAVHHEPRRRWVLVGTAADRAGGGGLYVHERRTGALQEHRNPIDAVQRVAAITTTGDLAILGGTLDATVVGWDLDGRSVRWRLDQPVPDGGTVTGVAVTDGLLSVATATGWYLVLDPATGALVRERRIGDGGGGLVVAKGRVYGVDLDRLYRLDPATGEATVLLDGLGSLVWGNPFLAADERGDLYVVSGTDVLRVRL